MPVRALTPVLMSHLSHEAPKSGAKKRIRRCSDATGRLFGGDATAFDIAHPRDGQPLALRGCIGLGAGLLAWV